MQAIDRDRIPEALYDRKRKWIAVNVDAVGCHHMRVSINIDFLALEDDCGKHS